jgi:putative copper export protein
VFRLVLTLHLLGAAVWTGGHLVLALGVLPGALRRRDPEPVRAFEARYERIAVPALLLQVVTGLLLAHRYLPDPAGWLSFATPLQAHVAAKLLLLAATLGLGLHARLRLVPRLDARTLGPLAVHIVAITLVAVGFMVVGAGFRTGGAFL